GVPGRLDKKGNTAKRPVPPAASPDEPRPAGNCRKKNPCPARRHRLDARSCPGRAQPVAVDARRLSWLRRRIRRVGTLALAVQGSQRAWDRPAVRSTNTFRQDAVSQVRSRSGPNSVITRVSPSTAPAAYLSATE